MCKNVENLCGLTNVKNCLVRQPFIDFAMLIGFPDPSTFRTTLGLEFDGFQKFTNTLCVFSSHTHLVSCVCFSYIEW